MIWTWPSIYTDPLYRFKGIWKIDSVVVQVADQVQSKWRRDREREGSVFAVTDVPFSLLMALTVSLRLQKWSPTWIQDGVRHLLLFLAHVVTFGVIWLWSETQNWRTPQLTLNDDNTVSRVTAQAVGGCALVLPRVRRLAVDDLDGDHAVRVGYRVHAWVQRLAGLKLPELDRETLGHGWKWAFS